MRRRILREKVVQALYAREVGGDSIEHVIKYVLAELEQNKDSYDFAKNLVIETIRYSTESDKAIRSKVANWTFKRVALLDKLILRMAVCELTHFTDIPPKVTINEAIEIARLFSTERSATFVNGVLDAIYGDLMLTGKLGKSGRGLWIDDGANRRRIAKLKQAK